MTEPALMTYQRVNKDASAATRKKTGKNKMVYLYNIIGFFMSMAAPYGSMSPFGLVFLTLERSLKKSTFIAFASVLLGSLMLRNKVLSAKYIAAEIIYLSVLFVLEKGIKISFKACVAAGVTSLLLSGAIVLYWQGVTLYAAAELAAELLLTAAGIFVFDRCKNSLQGKEKQLDSLSPLNRVCLCIVWALLLLSLKRMYIGNSISVINVAASVLMLCIALGTSAPVSAACGVILGMLCGIDTDFFLPLTGAFGFCGFLAGIFSRFGKGGASVGLILANAVLTVYTNNAIEPMLKVYEILLSIAVLVFIPEKFIENIKLVIDIKSSDREGILRLKEGIRNKLKSVSESFCSMANILENFSCEKEEDEYSDIGEMFDLAADKICKNCRKSPVCWGKDFNKTYRELFSLLKNMEKHGAVEESDISPVLKESCLNIEKLLDELSVQYDAYRMRKIWKSKLEESRELAGQQLWGMSKILDDIAVDIDKKSEIISSDSVRKALEVKGFKPRSIDVYEDKSGKIRISFILKKKYIANEGEKRILSCIKKLCPKEIQLSVSDTERMGYVKIKVFETELFTVEKGFACASAEKSSGDNFGFYKLSSGKYVVALSDGMGTGTEAARESRAVIELMDSFLRAGFDKKIAVKLINSVLLMKPENQSFATIDMCIIDLYTGQAEFIKTGAEPSYIKQDNGVMSVSGSSLPVGITAKAEPELFSFRLSEGDTIIMATDGMQTKTGGDSWLRKFIEESNSVECPGKFAERLLKRAEEINNGVKDDMTVISVKLHKKAS